MPVAQVIADFREEVRKTALETKCELINWQANQNESFIE